MLVHLVQGQMAGMHRMNTVTPVTLDWLGRYPEYHCEGPRTAAAVAVHSELAELPEHSRQQCCLAGLAAAEETHRQWVCSPENTVAAAGMVVVAGFVVAAFGETE